MQSRIGHYRNTRSSRGMLAWYGGGSGSGRVLDAAHTPGAVLVASVQPACKRCGIERIAIVGRGGSSAGGLHIHTLTSTRIAYALHGERTLR